MNEIEMLEIDIENLKNAYTNIIELLNNIDGIDDLDEDYKQLEKIAENIDNKRLDFENERDNLEEEAFYKENEEQWKLEHRQQEYDYENSKL